MAVGADVEEEGRFSGLEGVLGCILAVAPFPPQAHYWDNWASVV